MFGKNTAEVMSLPFSAHHNLSFMMSYVITGHNYQDHLVKVVSAGFLFCEVTIFPFVTNKYPEGVRPCKNHVYPQILSTNFSFFVCILPAVIIAVVF